MPFDADDLFELSRRYASAADRRDATAFVDVFAPGGSLTVEPSAGSGRPARTRSGEAELADVTAALSRYARTFHLLGQASYRQGVDADHATGEVYCVAHHLSVDGPMAHDHVMFIRYADDYRRDASGAWRIEHRRVQVDWTESRPAQP